MQHDNTWAALALGALCACLPLGVIAAPPASGWVAWASNRQHQRFEIFVARADGTEVLALTPDHEGRFPTWSRDGQWISYQRPDKDEAWIVRPDGSSARSLGKGQPRFWIDNARDGQGLAVQRGLELFLVDVDSAEATRLLGKTDFDRVADAKYEKFDITGMTANGRWLVVSTDFYDGGAVGDNGSFDHGWAPQLVDRDNPETIYLIGDGCEGTAHPTENWVYHINGEQYPETRVYKMRLASATDAVQRAQYQTVFDYDYDDWGHEYFPRISTDGRYLAYGASDYQSEDDHGHDEANYDIFIWDLEEDPGQRTRVIEHDRTDQWPHLFVGEVWQPTTPQLQLSNTLVTFTEVAVGDTAPPAVQLKVTNGRAETSTLAPLRVEVDYYGAQQDWLTIERRGEGNAQALDHTVALAGLTADGHVATVTVRADTLSASYDVLLPLKPAAEGADDALGLDQRLLAFAATTGQPKPPVDTLTARRADGEPLSPPLAAVTYARGAGNGWLVVAPRDATGRLRDRVLNNRVDATGLAPGEYSAVVAVSCDASDDCADEPQHYLVSLEVSEGPPSAQDEQAGGGQQDTDSLSTSARALSGGCTLVQPALPPMLVWLLLALARRSAR